MEQKQRISIEKNSGSPLAGVLGAFALIGGGLAILLFVYSKFLPSPPPFEISNFVGKPEVYSEKKGAWVPVERGASLGAHDKIRTNATSEVDMRMGQEMVLRLKGDSQLEGQGPKLFDRDLTYRLQLLKGALVGATDKQLKDKAKFELTTPVLVAAVRGTLFHAEVTQDGKSSIGVLRGQVEVRTKAFFNPTKVMVGNTQKVEVSKTQMDLKTVRITRDDWNKMKEAYELIQRSAAFEAMQIDLSKQAGTLYQNVVFDHGTFYTDKFGFAGREFFKDEETGEVYLEIDYDVFPRGAVVGMYIKTRDFDLHKYDRLEFEVRSAPDEGTPEVFRMEFKTRGQIQRVASPRTFKREWQPYQVIFSASKTVNVDEITIAFSHEHVGEHKKGTLQFRNFNLIPASEKAPGEEAAPAETPQPAAATQTLDTVTPTEDSAEPAAAEEPVAEEPAV